MVTTITDWYDLNNVRNDLSGDYELGNDLTPSTAGYDAVASFNANNGNGWLPIGNASTPFTGTFDGKGNTIDGLYIDRASASNVGLFANIDGGITDLRMKNATITANDYVGILAGEVESQDPTIKRVSVDGDITAESTVGCLVGYLRGTATKTKATGSVTANDDIFQAQGGLVGRNVALIEQSYADVSVSGGDSVGGIAGVSGGRIKNSFAVGDVSGSMNVGGFIGADTTPDGNSFDCYWDIDATGQSNAVGTGPDSDITGRRTNQMQNTEALGYMGLLDYESTWRPTSGYPELAWDSQYGSLGAAVDALLAGEGTSDNPYRIETAGDLQAMKGKKGASYELTGDLDASDAQTWHGGDGFEPVGGGSSFTGSFDGAGYAIDGLYIDSPSRANLFGTGLFGRTSGAEIRNLTLTNVDVAAQTQAGGGLVGHLVSGGTVENCSVDGTLSGPDASLLGLLVGDTRDSSITNSDTAGTISEGANNGGIAGDNDGTISGCSSSADVSGDTVGGIAGSNGGTVRDCHASGPVSTTNGTIGSGGGVAGDNAGGGIIENCTSTGAVSGVKSTRIGGVVGVNRDTDTVIRDCHWSGDDTTAVSSNKSARAGGVLGLCRNDAKVTRCYASGPVSCSGDAGGVVARIRSGTVTDCYWESTNTVFGDTVGGVVGYVGLFGAVTVKRCYADGPVSGESLAEVGSCFGAISSDDQFDYDIANCYGTGPLSGESDADIGGLIGRLEDNGENSAVADCYWDTETTGQSDAVAVKEDGANLDATGLTTAEIQGTSAESNMSALAFGSVWRVLVDPDDYPALDWEDSFLNISITDADPRLKQGDTYAVDVDVANNNDGSIDRTVSLLLDGTREDSASVSLASGQSDQLTLQTATEGKSLATYDVDVAGKTGDGTTVEIIEEWLQSSWTDATDGQSQYATPAVGPDHVYAGGLGSEVRAFDRSQQQQAWAFTRDGALADSSPLYDETRDRIYVGSGGGVLYALNVDGTEAWRHETDSALCSSPVLADGTVYVGANDGTVWALDATSGGSVEWSAQVAAPVYSRPAVDSSTVYVTDADGTVHALARSGGSVSWSTQTGGDTVASGPAVDSGTVYAATDAVYALAASDGSESWQTSYAGTAGSTPAVDSGRLYVGDRSGTVHALDAGNGGSQVWTYDAGGTVGAEPVVFSSSIVISSADGVVHAIDRDAGDGIATESIAGTTRSSPVVVEDTLYVGTDSDADGLVVLTTVPGAV